MSSVSRTEIENRIRRNRFVDARFRVLDPDGRALSGADLEVEQTEHEFLFGQTGFELVRSARRRAGKDDGVIPLFMERMKELFNAVTLPFYWGRFEPEEGKPLTEETREAARWFAGNGFKVKGHPLCWHTVCADWLMKYPDDVILEKQRARIRRDMTDFSGVIDMWDVVNEAVIMPVFDKYDNAVTRIAKAYGAENLVDMLFREARAANPDAVLLLNDFDLGPDYERLIERLLDRGTPIDVIGLQTHQHQGYRGAERIWDYAQRFSRFGLPLHFTETTIVSGKIMPKEIVDLNDYQVAEWPTTPDGEERQKEEATEFYSVLYSHPAVRGITWWGLIDGGWLNAPGGLLRKDMSEKPVWDALKRLIKGEWWTGKRRVRTGADGTVSLEKVTPGTYRVAAGGTAAILKIGRDKPATNVRLEKSDA